MNLHPRSGRVGVVSTEGKRTELFSEKSLNLACQRQKGKELNDFQRNLLDIEILSNLRFGSLEIRHFSYESNEQILSNLRFGFP